jgi:hypothetical protein
MRNVTVALGSFIVGAMSMSLLGNHTSTLAQAPERAHGSINIEGAVPIVPPFMNNTVDGASFGGGKAYLVDGILCRRCIFKDATLVYGGGEFAILEPRLSGHIDIKLDGAALNAATFLNLFGLLGCPANNMPKINPAPMMRAKYTPPGDFQIISGK